MTEERVPYEVIGNADGQAWRHGKERILGNLEDLIAGLEAEPIPGDLMLRAHIVRQDLRTLVDAADHTMRTMRGSRTQTRRLRWGFMRLWCALTGNDWRAVDLKHPPMKLRGLPPALHERLEALLLGEESLLGPEPSDVEAFLRELHRWHRKQASEQFGPDRPTEARPGPPETPGAPAPPESRAEETPLAPDDPAARSGS